MTRYKMHTYIGLKSLNGNIFIIANGILQGHMKDGFLTKKEISLYILTRFDFKDIFNDPQL
jgi:hypothetical protein